MAFGLLALAAMDAAQALADLTAVSSQIQGAVLAETGGTVLASTFGDGDRADRVAGAALRLLEAAQGVRNGGEELVQLETATPAGSVFLVRDDRHVVAAITGGEPTVGLVFYDLKTCLRMIGEEEEKPAAKSRRRKKEASDDGS